MGGIEDKYLSGVTRGAWRGGTGYVELQSRMKNGIQWAK